MKKLISYFLFFVGLGYVGYIIMVHFAAMFGGI
jgi:hypothetical protein